MENYTQLLPPDLKRQINGYLAKLHINDEILRVIVTEYAFPSLIKTSRGHQESIDGVIEDLNLVFQKYNLKSYLVTTPRLRLYRYNQDIFTGNFMIDFINEMIDSGLFEPNDKIGKLNYQLRELNSNIQFVITTNPAFSKVKVVTIC